MRKYRAVCLLLPFFVCAAQAAQFYNGQAARAVIGQSTFSAGISNAQAYVTGGANGVAYGNGYIWIADSNKLGFTPNNNRVLLFGTGEIPDPRADLLHIFQSGCPLCGFPAFNVLGQADYVSANPGRGATATPGTSGTGFMQTPSGVATDGNILVVADTDNNRVLIWNSLPLYSIGIAPDLVLGQANFTTAGTPSTPSPASLSGPVGVWVQNGKLFVADTSNSRILIWNSIPTGNAQHADLVLGQANFTAKTSSVAAANSLSFPTSVSSDGTRLFVADTGNNRVLIWNSIPTVNDQPADLVLGQPDMTSMTANNTALCNGGSLCAANLNFPQFALSDGIHLYVSDTGDDRLLIYNTLPTSNSPNADVVLGQPDFTSSVNTSQTISITSTVVDNTGAVDTIPSPTGLAWDGINLYVADPSNRRVLVFTPGDTPLPDFSVVNHASGPNSIRQEGIVTLALSTGTTVTVGDTVTITINSIAYTYTVKANDTLDTIAQGLVTAINAGTDANGAAALFAGTGTGSVYLSSKVSNPGFDAVSLATAASTSSSGTSTLTPVASGAYLTSGTAGTGAAGMLVEIDGTNLSDITAPTATTSVAGSGVQVYMDGVSAQIFSVSPNQIVAQVPFSFTNGTGPSTSTTNITSLDRNSTSVYVRTVHNDGSVTITNATPLYIAPANPGLFDAPGYPGQPRPYPATNALHQSGLPNVIVSVDGTVHAGDVATITIDGRNYTYTVVAADTLTTIQNALIAASSNDPELVPSAGAAFNRIIFTNRVGNAAIPVSAAVTGTSAALTLTAYSSATCCNVTPNLPITPANPAAPGELITVSATGLGVVSNATATNTVTATMGGSDAQVISAGLTPDSSSYLIQMIVPPGLTPNEFTQLYVAQNAFISNIVTIPVGSAVQAAPPGVGLASNTFVVGPPTLVFANQNLGFSSTTQTITVFNPQNVAQAFTVPQLSGTNPGSFAMTNGCVSPLAATATCTINITYNTGGTGVNTASLALIDSAGLPHTVSLLGYSVASFEIRSRFSGKVLDVTGASTVDGAVIQQWDYLSGANQQWSFVPLLDGSYVIMNSLSGKVLDVTGLSTIDGAVIQQWDYVGNANQKWLLVPTPDGYYKIQNVLSGKVLDVTGISSLDGAVIQQWDSYADPGNQQWSLISVQYYEILNVNSGKVLDVQGISNQDGAFIQQWDYLGGPNQQWQIIPFSGSSLYFSIMSRNSGKVLDVINQSTQDGANIQQFDLLGRTNQLWAFLATDVSGAFEIDNEASGRVLDVTGLSTVDGALIQQYDFLNGANQKWVLVPVGVQ